VFVIVGAIFLMGATTEKSIIENGRYQISAWGDGGAHGSFIVDTVSGETRIVYMYKELGNGKSMVKSNLNKPYSLIK
jgi:hypothetical protein